MLICSFPARATAMRLTVQFVGLLTWQAIRTPSTLNVPTHCTCSSPCVLETPQYDICHRSNRVHARFLPNWLPTPSKILPKSSCLASRGTFPWSAFVDSDILGMLNAPLPPQPLELDFQTLELYFQKSPCFASRGTFPWSAFVDSDILGMLNAPLTFQPFEYDFQTFEHSNLTFKHSILTTWSAYMTPYPLPNVLTDDVHPVLLAYL